MDSRIGILSAGELTTSSLDVNPPAKSNRAGNAPAFENRLKVSGLIPVGSLTMKSAGGVKRNHIDVGQQAMEEIRQPVCLFGHVVYPLD